MRVQESMEKQSNNPKYVDLVTNSSETLFDERKVQSKGNNIDISSIVMDDEAYKGQGKTVKDVMQEAELINVGTLRNYMAVMSNSMSDKDFAKLQEEGFHPEAMDASEVVTILDRIKATLIASGVEVAGYTDTLGKETLSNMYGDARSAQVQKMLHASNLATNPQAIETATKALDEGMKINPLSESAKKYIVENNLDLSIENTYKAQFSVNSEKENTGRGYFREEQQGYYSKKSETLDWERLQPQVENRLDEMGVTKDTKTIENAKWLVENGIPLQKESLLKIQEINQVKLPLEEDKLLKNITLAISNQKNPMEALISKEPDLLNEARQVLQKVNEINPEAISLIEKGKKITISLLYETSMQLQQTMEEQETQPIKQLENQEKQQVVISKNTLDTISAKRQLEEIRLTMSIEANFHLMKKGFSIETSVLSEVVEQLKGEEKRVSNILFSTSQSKDLTEEDAILKNRLFIETNEKRNELFQMPAALVGKIYTQVKTITVAETYTIGKELQATEKNAIKQYETLGTAPRSDLGDSIQKAFQNVDTLLEELSMQDTNANQRAIRILGYNQMPISEENVLAIKEADATLQSIIDELTPANTLQLIRQGINPLELTLEQVYTTVHSFSKEEAKKEEKYATYLQKQEQQGFVSEEEKEAYIGIYRLLRQVEKTDGEAIGRIVNQGTELSFQNLLAAVKSTKYIGKEYRVDDTFGGVEAKRDGKSTISQQITNYYTKLATNLADQVESNREKTLTIEGEQIQSESSSSKSQYEMLEARFVSDTVFAEVIGAKETVSSENLLFMAGMLENRGQGIKNLQKTCKKVDESIQEVNQSESTFEGKLLDIVESTTNAFLDPESIYTEFERIEKLAKQMVDASTNLPSLSAEDRKSISMLYKQMSFVTKVAKEEVYEVPVLIGSEITSVNVRIIHKRDDKGKVAVSLENETYGKVTGSFKVENNTITGYVAISKKEAIQDMQEKMEKWELQLSSKGYASIQTEVLLSDTMNLETFGYKNRDELRNKETMKETETTKEAEATKETENGTQKETTSTKQLYQVAKAFLETLQE